MNESIPLWLKGGSLLCMIVAVFCSKSALKTTLKNIEKMQNQIPGKNPLVKQAQLNFYGVIIILSLIVAALLELLNNQSFVIFLTATLGVYGINLTKDKDKDSNNSGSNQNTTSQQNET